MISAIILASGYSRRMGRNKLLLKYRGKSLVEHTIDIILQCSFLEAILVAREEEIINIGNRNFIKVIKNENAFKGISESIKLGVSEAGESEGYMFFTGDQPFLDMDTVKKLAYTFKEHSDCIIIPRFKGKRGSPVIFPCIFKEDFLNLEGDVGGKIVINKNLDRVKYVEVQDDRRLFDVDTNESYEYILQLEEKNEYV